MSVNWTTYLLAVALAAAVLGGALLYVFVRPVQSRTTRGYILSKTYQEARILTRKDVGPRRELWGESERKLPAGYMFTIRLEDGAEVQYSLEETAAGPFQVGDWVAVTYDLRGIPGVWSKRYVSVLAPFSR